MTKIGVIFAVIFSTIELGVALGQHLVCNILIIPFDLRCESVTCDF